MIFLLDDFRLFLSWSLDSVLAASDDHYVRRPLKRYFRNYFKDLS